MPIDPAGIRWDETPAPAAPAAIDPKAVKWDGPAVAPKEQVSPLAMLGRQFVAGGGDVINFADTLRRGIDPAGSIASAITGQPDITTLEAAEAAKRAHDFGDLSPAETPDGLSAKIAGGVGRVIPNLAAAVAAGPASLESLVPASLARIPLLGRALLAAGRGAPTAAAMTTDQAANLPANLTPAQQATETGKNAGLNLLLAGLPVALGTGLATRTLTGAALGAAIPAGSAAVQGQDQDAASNIVGALTGAMMAQGGGAMRGEPMDPYLKAYVDSAGHPGAAAAGTERPLALPTDGGAILGDSLAAPRQPAAPAAPVAPGRATPVQAADVTAVADALRKAGLGDQVDAALAEKPAAHPATAAVQAKPTSDIETQLDELLTRNAAPAEPAAPVAVPATPPAAPAPSPLGEAVAAAPAPAGLTMDDLRAAMNRSRLAGDAAGNAAALAPVPPHPAETPSAPAEAAASSPVIPRAAAPAVTPEDRPPLEHLRGEIGWDQKGGRLLRQFDEGGEKPEVIGRTSWVGKAGPDGESNYWRMRPAEGGKLSEAQAHKALDKYAAGEKLNPREQRFIDYSKQVAADYDARAAELSAEMERDRADMDAASQAQAMDELRAHQADIPADAHDEALTLAQWMQRAHDAGVAPAHIIDATWDGTPGEQAAKLSRAIINQESSHADDTRAAPVSGESHAGPDQGRQAATGAEPPAEGFALANPEPRAEGAPRPVAQQTGLFVPATTAEHVRAASTAKDEARNGLAGGKTDTGDGGLFDGKRPKQVDVQDESDAAWLARAKAAKVGSEANLAHFLLAKRHPETERAFQAQFGQDEVARNVAHRIWATQAHAEERSPASVDHADADPGRQLSIDQGNADADRLGLRAAVAKALGPVADRIEYMYGYEGLPEKMRKGVESRNALGRKGVTAAMYSPETGRVFIFTQVTKTPDRAVWHAAHEIAGHEGLRALLGDRLDPALNLARQNPTVKALADEIYSQRKIADQMKKSGRPPGDGFLLATEEALAELAAAVRTGNYEHINERYGVDVKPSMRESVKKAIANFLKRLKAMIDDIFGSHVFSDADVRDLLEAAWQAAKHKGATANGEHPGRSSSLDQVEDQTQTPAFKRWFGESKVVDADGKPLVVYHGTNEDVAAFADASRGSATGAKSALAGHWFVDDAETAKGYANHAALNAPVRRAMERAEALERKAQRSGKSSDWDAHSRAVDEYERLDGEMRHERNRGQNIIPAYLSIKNPAIFDAEGKSFVDLADEINEFLSNARRTGHDGAILRDLDDDPGFSDRVATHYVAFRPEQIKSATGNRGTFDPDSGSILESTDYTPEQKDFMRKAGMAGAVDERTAIKRALDGLRDKVPYPDADAFRQGAIDKFHGIKRAVDEKGGVAPEDNPYLAAEMIQTASTMEAILRFGAPELHQGALRVKRDVPGLLDALTPVRDQMPQWLGWMVARRAKVLQAQGRENALSDADIQAGLSLATDHEAEFKEAALGYLKLKNAILDLAEQTGIIDPEARKAWDHAEYIPFYRDMDAGFSGPGTRQGLANQSSGIRTLKGGESPLKDPLGNIIANFTRLLDASMKNRATLLAVDQLGAPYFRKAPLAVKAETIPLDQVKRHLLEQGVDKATIAGMPADALKGVARMLAVKAPEGEDIVRVMRNGKAEYYHVDDPLLLRSLTAFNEGGTHWSLKPLVWFKQLLTAGATATPDFLIRNALRDTGEASVTSKDRFVPLVDTVRGAIDSFRESELAQDLMMAGAAFHGGLFHTGNNEDTAKAIKRALRKHGLTDSAIERYVRTLINPKRLWDIYRSVSEATEMGSRVSLARKRLAAGATPVEAAHEAKDFLNFQRRGDDKFVLAFTKMIPFLNARLQGADRLYRVGTTKGRRGKVATRLAMMAMLTMLLYWWNQEEHKDAYDEIPDWDKDANWHIAPGTDHYLRIPKPFELGLVGGTVPERMYGALRYQLTNGEEGDRPAQSWDAFMRGMGSALGINPIPQAVMPIVEDIANKSLYFDTPIESMGDRYKAPSDRFGPTTSPTMKAASKGMAALFGEDRTLSPKRLQHFWTGYTAGMGRYLLDGADWVTRKLEHAPEQPALALRDFPLVGTVARGGGPARSTRYVDEFYDLAERAQVHSGAVKDALHNGDTARAARIEKEWGWLLGQREGSKRAKEGFMHGGLREINRVRDQLSAISKDNAKIYADRTMSGEAKRKALDANLEKRNALVRKVVRQLREAERKSRG
jgi:hypothetical protein